jgi:hypothetical protein
VVRTVSFFKITYLPTYLDLRKGFLAIVSMAFGRGRSVSWSDQTTHGNEMNIGGEWKCR